MINQGNSIATVKTEIADALALVGVEDPTSWSDATAKLNARAFEYGLEGIADGMAGGTARARINAVIAGLETPANVTLPTVTGNAVQGETLTTTTGTWTGLAPITYAYQWFNSEADITGATASTYVLTEDDIGLTVGVRVTATNVRGPVGVESDVTAPVTGGGVLGPQQLVGSWGEVPRETGAAATTSNLKHGCRRPETVYIDVRSPGIILLFSAYAARRSGVGEVDGSAYSVEAHIEINGVSIRATFSGASVGAVPAGAVGFSSDPISADKFGIVTSGFYPAFVYSEKTHAVGGTPVYIKTTATGQDDLAYTPPSGASYWRGNSTAVSKIGTSGPLDATGGWTALAGTGGHDCIVSQLSHKLMAVGVVGASIEFGADGPFSDGFNSLGGYTRIGTKNVGGDDIPSLNLALRGEAASQFLAASPKRQQYLKYCSHWLNGYGGNDFSNGRTTAQLAGDLAAIDARLKAYGARIGRLRLIAKTDSSDQWATVSGQVLRVGAGGLSLVEYRSIVDAAAAVDFTVSTSEAIESTGTEGKFIANGTPFFATTDGTHLTNAIHVAAAAFVRASLSAERAIYEA